MRRFVFILTAALGLGLVSGTCSAGEAGPPHPEGLESRRVQRVIDGDTLVLDGGERVRLIGVDTPETVHPQKPVERFGKEASAFTRRMAEGKEVYLEYEGVRNRDAAGEGRYRVHALFPRLATL